MDKSGRATVPRNKWLSHSKIRFLKGSFEESGQRLKRNARTTAGNTSPEEGGRKPQKKKKIKRRGGNIAIRQVACILVKSTKFKMRLKE